MNDVYIKATDLNTWIIKHLPKNKDLYTIDDLICAIEDMDGEIENLQSEIEIIKEDIRENYKPISDYEKYGVSERDF